MSPARCPAIWANGWYGGACAHRAGTRSSRRWPSPASGWPGRWLCSAVGRRAATEPSGRQAQGGSLGGKGRGWGVREGSLHGGLPYLAVGQGPPLVVFSGLTAEHASSTGLTRRFELQTLKPLARHFTVYAVNRKPGLPTGTTIKDLAGHYADAIAHEFQGPVSVEGISTGRGHLHGRIDHPAVRHRPPPPGPPAGAGRHRLPAASPGPGGTAPLRRANQAGPPARLRHPRSRAGGDGAAEDVFNASPQLHRIAAPTLLVAGGRDRYYSPELFRETAERIPNARPWRCTRTRATPAC